MRWLQGAPQDKDNPEISIAERFQAFRSFSTKNNDDVIPPLVKQATAYAMYLNPPEPPAPKEAPQPKKPVHRSLGTTPKFRLLSTTYYRSSPEKSLALVSEPGRGAHWIKKGERLGQFVVESVEKGAIVYRDGNQSHEMRITIKETVQLAQIKSNMSASTRAIKPNLRLLEASQSTDVE
jgi:hypothetical protein